MLQRYERSHEVASLGGCCPTLAGGPYDSAGMPRRRTPLRSTVALILAATSGVAACTGRGDPVPAPSLRPIPSTVPSDESALQPVEGGVTAETNTVPAGTIEWSEIVDGIAEITGIDDGTEVVVPT